MESILGNLIDWQNKLQFKILFPLNWIWIKISISNFFILKSKSDPQPCVLPFGTIYPTSFYCDGWDSFNNDELFNETNIPILIKPGPSFHSQSNWQQVHRKSDHQINPPKRSHRDSIFTLLCCTFMWPIQLEWWMSFYFSAIYSEIYSSRLVLRLFPYHTTFPTCVWRCCCCCALSV